MFFVNYVKNVRDKFQQPINSQDMFSHVSILIGETLNNINKT